ncbi:MAG: FecR domain-containing protein [Eubacterium sp.]|nr:FecR domain-containing protein [Eubacterium sp.]
MEPDLVKKKKIKVLIILGAALAIIILTGLLILFFRQKDKTYRLLKVYEMAGDGEVEREGIGKLDPYTNMNLESGDRIKLDEGVFNIKADDDKYIFLNEKTELVLEATGDEKNSKIRINLLSGGITNDIRNKLTGDSSYEVNTPNSTMSVVGTIFFVCNYQENGIEYTKVSVFDGTVSTKLKYQDGTLSTEEVKVSSGKEVLIYQDENTTDYIMRDVAYDELPENVLRILGRLADEDRPLSITKEEIVKLLEGPFTVIFTYEGREFGRQTVKKGEYVAKPTLAPASGGEWDYDFTKPVDRDLIIEWK